MNSRIVYLILRNSAKLKKLIESDAPYEKILRQSRRLDKYIVVAMKSINGL